MCCQDQRDVILLCYGTHRVISICLSVRCSFDGFVAAVKFLLVKESLEPYSEKLPVLLGMS